MFSDGALWERMQRLALDDPDSDLKFSDRLARENGWPKRFALRAIDEYKRFVYLASTGEAPATPSDIVDQVWHLHLTFTRSYWDKLCGEVLKRPLHHGPTKGGPAEAARYRGQYAETLARYRAEFDGEPPAEFWPDEVARFSSAAHQRWVDRRTHFVVRRPVLGTWWRRAAGASAVAMLAAGAAQGAEAGYASTLSGDGLRALVVIGLLIAVVATLMAGDNRKGKKDNGGSCGGGGGGSGSSCDNNGDCGGGDGGGGGCGGGGCGGD